MARRAHPLRGIIIGTISGLVASWAMEAFQRRLSGQSSDGGASATHKAADRASEVLRNKEVAPKDKTAAGEAVHYATGTALGAGYGVLNELTPRASAGFGTGFGAAVTVLLDQLTVPALGLSKKPTAYPLKTHAFGLASHLVYGAALEGMRRLLGGRRRAGA